MRSCVANFILYKGSKNASCAPTVASLEEVVLAC